MALGKALIAAVAVLLIIVIAGIVALMVRGLSYMQANKDRSFPRRLLSDVFPLKTGDIVLFIASTHGFSNSLFTQQLFSHIGIVVEIDGRLNLAESTPGDTIPGISVGSGDDLVPLLTRLKTYCGQTFVMPLTNALELNSAKELVRAARSRCRYPSLAQLASAIALGGGGTRHCFEHVGALLDAAGLHPERPFSSYGPIGVCDPIISLPGATLQNGASYAPPYQLLYDI